jgi:nucleotide-binding universal stress UspA family protein
MSEVKGQIIVGVDGSPASINALKWALNIGTQTSQSVKVVTTWDGTYISVGVAAFGGVDPDDDSVETRKGMAVENQIATFKAVFGDSPAPASVTSEIIEGKAAEALIKISKGASMLVLGTRGHGHLADIVLGSVSSACVLKAACPVTVVRENTRI